MNEKLTECFERAGLEAQDSVYAGLEALRDTFDIANYSAAEELREKHTLVMNAIARIMTRMDTVSVALMYAVGSYEPRNETERETLDFVVEASKSEDMASDPCVTRFQLMETLMKQPDYNDLESIDHFQDGLKAIAELIRPSGYTRGAECAEEALEQLGEDLKARAREQEQLATAIKFSPPPVQV